MYRYWKNSELIQLYHDHKCGEKAGTIAAKLNRSTDSVYKKIARIKAKKRYKNANNLNDKSHRLIENLITNSLNKKGKIKNKCQKSFIFLERKNFDLAIALSSIQAPDFKEMNFYLKEIMSGFNRQFCSEAQVLFLINKQRFLSDLPPIFMDEITYDT